jgi:hypothetical protein
MKCLITTVSYEERVVDATSWLWSEEIVTFTNDNRIVAIFSTPHVLSVTEEK